MNALLASDPILLRVDAEDVLRVGPTRVSLDSVVAAFNQGSNAEEIVQQYPALTLPDVYATIAHVLRHRPQFDAYRAARRATAEAVRAEAEAR